MLGTSSKIVLLEMCILGTLMIPEIMPKLEEHLSLFVSVYLYLLFGAWVTLILFYL